VIIEGNFCNDNTKYGIVYQGIGGTIANNYVESNGDSVSNGGILLNAWQCTVSGNNIFDNSYYGIDAGGSVHCVISGNVITYNGNSSGLGATAVNIGAALDMTIDGNTFENNGTTGSVNINCAGFDGAGSVASGGYFTTIGARAVISNNIIKVASGGIGIWVHDRQPSVERYRGQRVPDRRRQQRHAVQVDQRRRPRLRLLPGHCVDGQHGHP
jgi:parallel beta-helix repeat protein